MSLSISSHTNYLAEIRNFMPSTSAWNRIPHKGMKALPEDEIKAQLLDLASRIAPILNAPLGAPPKGSEDFGVLSEKVSMLFVQYVSYASPDRKAMFEEAKNTLGNGGEQSAKGGQMSLIDVLLEKTKQGKSDMGGPQYTRQTLPCGAQLEPIGSLAGNGFALSLGGQTVLEYVGGTLSWGETRDEKARNEEIMKFYFTALETARRVERASRPANDMDRTARLDVKI